MALVGDIVESVTDLPLGASTSTARSDGADFVINSIPFRVKSTDDTPYQRATAQFRKDQYDTGQTAGDQSLTGWWTRGQFSFHHGAGITYYEVSEGETILNRFKTGSYLDPFVPGKLTCQKKWTAYGSTFSGISQVDWLGNDLIVLDSSGDVTYGDLDATPSTYSPGGGTVVGFAISPTKFFALVSDSTVTEVDLSTGTPTTLYNGFASGTRGIWYAKSRLIVSDGDGTWYQLATNPTGPPVAVASTDAIFTAVEWDDRSCVTDTPGPVLIGNANKIYALTLDSTGTIPTLSAPVMVSELPPGEIVASMVHHLGFVILVTSAGVRVAVLSDSGQLTYGPVLIERQSPTLTPPVTSVGRYGTRVAVVIDNTTYEIDLSEEIGNGLEFGYIGRGSPFGTPTNAGMATYHYSTQLAWDDSTVWHSGTDLEEGTLTTGLHRFNTLEPKRFDSVRIVASGTAGSIGVTRVDADGTETSLYTMNVSQNKVLEIALRMDTSAEAVGLKFVLTPDAGDPTSGPTLLGYQLRALPEPKRQRLIKVPLLLNDVERRQPGRATGTLDSSWTRLSELEELESTNAIVSFSDLRTGEAGRAYIETIEFVNTTPPSVTSKGFGGGVLFVTLRKL